MFKLLSEYTKVQDERMKKLSESQNFIISEWTKKFTIW